MLLSILRFPHKILSNKACYVETIDQGIQELVANMYETMYAAKGIGLAANQVGVLKRIFIMDLQDQELAPTTFINPEIVEKSGSIVWEEGCLSFPDIYAKVKRSENIRVNFLDIDGNHNSLQLTGLAAVCVQHELDHLNGITFYDHLSAVKKEMLRNKINKMRDKDL